MKRFIILMTVSSLILGITSCDNEDLVNPSTNQTSDFTLRAKYKDVLYEVPGKLDEEGNPIYLNKEFNDLYQNELSTHPTLVTLVTDENVVEYYESLDEVLDVNNIHLIELENIPNVSEVMTRATAGQSGRVITWDDSNYSDRSLTFDIGYADWWIIPQLRNYNNFNDKISSLKIWGYINPAAIIQDNYNNTYSGSDLRVTFVGYEDDNYRGKVLLCLCPPNGAYEQHRLGNFGWNDKITALRVLLTSMNNGKGRLDNPAGVPGYPSITPYSPL